MAIIHKIGATLVLQHGKAAFKPQKEQMMSKQEQPFLQASRCSNTVDPLITHEGLKHLHPISYEIHHSPKGNRSKKDCA